MPKQNGQHRTARAPKQRARKCAGCTHYGVNRTRKGYGKQCLGAFGAIPASEKIQFSEGKPDRISQGFGNTGQWETRYLVDPGRMSSPGCGKCDLTWNDCVMTPHGWV